MTPASKGEILARYEDKAAKVQREFERGLITDQERRQELIEVWTQASNEVQDAMEEGFDKLNPIFMMVNSGARGNMLQVKQISGMLGLVANPKGEIIPRPIKSNLREGMTVLEYFIATHGARKGLADTALRTADSGYLTRRLVDVSQDVIVRDEDCGTERGLVKQIATQGKNGLVKVDNIETSVYSRVLAEDALGPDGEVVLPARSELGSIDVDLLVAAGVTSVRIRIRPHLRLQGGHVRQLLRPVARDQPARRHRRGSRHRRRPVDR